MGKFKAITEVKDAYIAPSAQVMGDVTIDKNASVWYGTVVRGDDGPIHIGEGSNIQDNCVIHVDVGSTVEIGKNVTIGHGCILHGCRIGDETLIGMGAILLDGAAVGKNCLVAAGALVSGKTVIPDGCLAIGSPARIKRNLTEEEKEANRVSARTYIETAREHFE